MRKIKTKAELKSVGDQSGKDQDNMTLTCGLCYKVLFLAATAALEVQMLVCVFVCVCVALATMVLKLKTLKFID